MSESEMVLSGRKVLVVGASSGIGAAFARAVAARGGDVVASARRAERLERLVDEINDSDSVGRAFGVVGDASDPTSAKDVAAEAAALLGGLDLMVYVAGYGVLQRLSEVDPDTWQSVFGVNVIGANLATGAAISHMGPDGVVAFVSSRTVEDSSALFATYTATKAALDQSIRNWRSEHPTRRFVRIVMGNTQPSEFHEHMGLDLMTEAINRWGEQALPSGLMHSDDVGAAMAESLAVTLKYPGIDSSELKFDARRPESVFAE